LSPEMSGPLVTADEVAEHRKDPGVLVADVRWIPDGTGRQRFEEGHIPGAVYLDVDEDLSAPPVGPGGRHPLPPPEFWADTMSRAGFADDDLVVCYDDAMGSHAVRLWWMLTVTGRRAAVLDGGLHAWARPLSTGPEPARSARGFSAKPWPRGPIADAEDVKRAIEGGTAVVLDARTEARFLGDEEPYDAKAGHIPGARSAPWDGNIDPKTQRFLSPVVLRRRYQSLKVDDAARAVVYCGSGVTSPHDVLAMVIGGLGMPRLYVGSWSDWISDDDRSVATGP
jgi:thiosulfate/3-mercaptopyruvate sulfurtransferase